MTAPAERQIEVGQKWRSVVHGDVREVVDVDYSQGLVWLRYADDGRVHPLSTRTLGSGKWFTLEVSDV